MRFGPGFNRPPPLVKRHNYAEEFGYKDSFDRPPPTGKREIPLPPRPRQSPFRPMFEDEFDSHDEYEEQGYRSKSGSWGRSRGGSTDNRADSDRLSRCSSHGRGSIRDGRGVQFETQDLAQSRDWYDNGRDSRRRVQRENTYRGGYDFRDEVESIDSWEEEQRQRLRREQARQGGLTSKERQASPAVSSLRKLNRYGSRDSVKASPSPVSSLRKLSRYDREYRENSVESSRLSARHSSRREKSNSFRRDGETLASTIATNEDNLSLGRTMSTFTHDSYINPQFLNARTVPELPPGYLQRNDGVVISIGSSLASDWNDERYADAAPLPEVAAQEVVENLRALGYTVDDKNGILGSDSDSGDFSKYGDPLLSAQSKELRAQSSRGTAAKSKSRRVKVIPSIHSPPAVELCAKNTMSTGRASTCTSSRSSRNESASRAKSSCPSNGSQSRGSRNHEKYELAPVTSKGSRRSSKQLEPQMSLHSDHENEYSALADAEMADEVEFRTNQSIPEESQAEEFTTLADGSTFTSRADDTMERRRGKVIVDMRNTQLVGSGEGGSVQMPSDPTPSLTEKRSTPSKQVEFSGEEFPEMTRDGDRVPELVTNIPGLSTVVSDLSHQRSIGTSTLSSLSFLNKKQESSLDTFCDKVLYSCRISAFPSTRAS